MQALDKAEAKELVLCRCRSGGAFHISCKAYKDKWKSWKAKRKGWEESKILQMEAKKKLLQPSAALPVFAGLAVASMFGKSILLEGRVNIPHCGKS